LIGGEVDHPGLDPEEHGNILERAAVISDDDIGTLLDEILRPPDFDLFAEKEKTEPALKSGLNEFKGSFEIFHQLPAAQLF
jgi:hypothetical protein